MDQYTSWDNIPDNLKTRTALKKQGLRPKRSAEPVAQKISVWRSKTSVYDLYDTKDCEPVKPLTPAQRAAVEKAQEASLKARTCQGCGYVQALGEYRITVYDGLCPTCYDEATRKEDRDEAAAWARRIVNGLAEGVIEAHEVVILDSETVDLNDEIIDLAIINLAGEVVYNQRFKPVREISPGAQAVHGLTAEMLAGEPRFSDEWPQIRAVLASAQLILIYNAEYDVGVLRHTCRLHGVEFIDDLPVRCVMQEYARWFGEWSRRYQSYTWQRLPGGDHTALGDCRATLEVVQSMAAWTDRGN